ncbi:cubilin [Elysia marginata]|uniref:Cubilin n=1 Tax=Elysia marginata TaxID=1093978 RepID=A0AAV4I2R1_9GAST|nr:cubilin [Elysia marginata]
MRNCRGKEIKIFDGSTSGKQLGNFCTMTKETFTSTSNYLILTVRGYYLIGTFSLQYKQACGGDRSDSAGIIQSPGFPKSYVRNLDCWWKITVPDDRTIRVTLNKTFDIFTGLANTCPGDYLQLFNGFDQKAPPLVKNASSNSNGRYCGATAPSDIPETSSNVLTVKFVSDGSKSGAGFSLKYTEHHFACGGRLKLTDGITSGFFTSPNYPKSYPRNLDCKWLIVAPAAHRVQVDFDKFEIELHTNCDGDYLQFFDGGSSNSPKIGKRLCGKQLPGSVTSSGNMLLARFTTDKATVHKGFRAKYSIATCGGRITAAPSFVTSPNFPSNYGAKLSCFWIIQGPVGHYLTINITKMNLQKSVRCSADVLEIIDPASLTVGTNTTKRGQESSVSYRGISVIEAKANASGSVLFKGCGQKGASKSFETADNRVYVWFKSDATVGASGFKIDFNASIEECGGDRSTSSGSFSSPNYPHLYAHKRVCTWDITVAVGRKIKLTFNDNFYLDEFENDNCKHDFVEVRNGLYQESPTLGKFCGQKRPDPVWSSGNTMRVKFLTDHKMSSTGFKASYTSDEEAVCGGRLTKGPGSVISPGFSGNQSYSNNLQCVWQIQNKVAQNSSIRLEFKHFDVQYDLGCHKDYVQIREGVDYNGRLIGKFCGNSANSKQWRYLINETPVVVIPTANIWIAFITDKSGGDKGFQMNYTFTDCGGVLTGSEGVIVSPNYPGNYSNNIDCAWLIKAPDGMTIQVNFTAFELEQQPECTSDFLVIQNGGNYDSPEIGRYCGNTSIGVIKSQSNQLRLVLVTGDNGTAGGFRLEYGQQHTGCGGHYHKNKGSIASPNYPRSYSDNSQCRWDITVDIGYHVRLKLKSPFDVSCNDSVQVYDVISDYSSRSIGSFCFNGTNEQPDVVDSSWTKMRVVFQSDALTNGNGFSADYTAECGGSVDQVSAVLRSPGYPGYKNNLRCGYTVDPGDNYFVFITFDDFHLQDSSGCNSDFLRIHHGSNAKGKRLRNLCGDNPVDKFSFGGPIFLDFKTDGSKTFRGYKAHYKAAVCGGNFTTQEGTLMTPFFPKPYPRNMNCTWNVTVEEKKIIFFKFEDYHVSWSWKCWKDEMKAYDGNSIRARRINLPRECGDKGHRDNWWKTTGNHLLINMRVSHHGSHQVRGFKAFYHSSYGPKAGCGGTFTSQNGSFESLDIDNDGLYEPGLDCTWKITANSGKIVVLNITDFDVAGDSSNCEQDYLQINDGYDHTIRTLCGKKNKPVVIRSTHRIVYVRFKTDGTNSSSGFNATYSQEESTCGKVLSVTSKSQTLSSPTSLDEDSRCRWTLDTRDGNKQVKITVNDQSLGTDCKKVYLEIHDEPMGEHGQKYRACGSRKPPVFYSRVQKASVIYHGGLSGNFSLSYERAGCNRNYKSAAGRVTSPKYPSVYRGSGCTVEITASEGSYLSLYFSDLDIKEIWTWFYYWTTCSFEFTITSDGFKKKVPCGRTSPPVFLSKTKAKISFKSKTARRWRRNLKYAATFIASSKGKGCGGNISHAIPGMFTNPPSPKNVSLECIWELDSSKLVRLRLENLRLPGGGGNAGANPCADSYLEILGSDGSSYGKKCTIAYPYEVDLKKGKIKYYVARGAAAPTFKLKFYHMDEVI